MDQAQIFSWYKLLTCLYERKNLNWWMEGLFLFSFGKWQILFYLKCPLKKIMSFFQRNAIYSLMWWDFFLPFFLASKFTTVLKLFAFISFMINEWAEIHSSRNVSDPYVGNCGKCWCRRRHYPFPASISRIIRGRFAGLLVLLSSVLRSTCPRIKEHLFILPHKMYCCVKWIC